MKARTYCGGIFDTNCFFLFESGILIDAPQGAADWLKENGWRVSTLLLTHGHIDHVWDAACIQREHCCEVGYHIDGEPMVTERDFFKSFGFGWEIDPIQPGFHIEEAEAFVRNGVEFKVLLVPGHCPGSLCFLEKAERVLYGGDVLFAGGVGRWDLPGGDAEMLFSGIKSKVFPLGDDVVVMPGHGPSTTVGIERETNPFVGESSD